MEIEMCDMYAARSIYTIMLVPVLLSHNSIGTTHSVVPRCWSLGNSVTESPVSIIYSYKQMEQFPLCIQIRSENLHV